MTSHFAAVVTIGQTPRPDLLEPLLDRAASGTTIIEIGALDELTPDAIPTRSPRPSAGIGGNPLTTRLRDGSSVTVDEGDLVPLVQQAVDCAERAGADITLLLCAGGFVDVTAVGTLIRPFEAAVATVRATGARRVAVVVPYEGQASNARRKWAAAGFHVHVVVGDLAALELPVDLAVDVVVLDYVGHAARDVRALRARAPVPVVDLGECGADAAVVALMRPGQEQESAIR